jgi:hypothetical protein
MVEIDAPTSAVQKEARLRKVTGTVSEQFLQSFFAPAFGQYHSGRGRFCQSSLCVVGKYQTRVCPTLSTVELFQASVGTNHGGAFEQRPSSVAVGGRVTAESERNLVQRRSGLGS